MYEELKITPLTHEIALTHVVSYINTRLEKISRQQTADVIKELILLSNYARHTAYLKGDHISKILATLFGLIKERAGEGEWWLNKNLASEVLTCHKEIMENDIARKIPEYKNNKPSFYVLDAYFPSYKKNMCVGLVEKSYYYAARKVRERFGEFHKKTFQKFKSNSEPSKNNLELILIL
ncbi:MAG: hypothetical protein QT11_C0001G0299 [archaeon GW2011_AR20]|nr:MAG: hypothetical protein QT11_C0001G0299 [archaeon GW2011_AR20]AQS28467.1 hypothetical protein [uncultured archaeon]MBS3160306.1 hypothetical protein [Candidatus Woesearchaeota archaeon]